MKQVARVTLAVADMGVALRLPRGYPIEHWRSLAVILGAGMVLMGLVSGLLVWGLLGVSFWAAMLVGATVTSIDPIVATTIVTGPVPQKNIPGRIRHFISAESGANDGAVYPLVLLPILILTRPTSEALSRWIVYRRVAGRWGCRLGAAVGYVAARLFEWSDRAEIIEQRAFIAYTFAFTCVVLGAARLLSMDGILAAFVAGIAYRMAPGTQQPSKEKNVQKAMTKFFVLPTFVLFGVAIPWEGCLAGGVSCWPDSCSSSAGHRLYWHSRQGFSRSVRGRISASPLGSGRSASRRCSTRCSPSNGRACGRSGLSPHCCWPLRCSLTGFRQRH